MFRDWYKHSIKRKIIVRSVQQYMLLLSMNCTTATKANTHYETLGIPLNATFNEIKSAYYKLTLKYHPDKNKSAFAKKKFHEISNAYDILSKYESRKQYDRTILTKSKNLHYVKHKATSRSNVEHTQHPSSIYNFDEWIKMHYSIAFTATMEKKEIEKMTRAMKEREHYEKLNINAIGIIAVICLSLLCVKILVDSKKFEWKNRKP